MPAVLVRSTGQIELRTDIEWSWPDHPKGMDDTEARIRVSRASGTSGSSALATDNLPEEHLAIRYGRLLERGEAGIQASLPAGDHLPRAVHGSLLSIKQQVAADLTEQRFALPPGVYDLMGSVVDEVGAHPPRSWGALNDQSLATWLPRGDHAEGDVALAARAVEGATDSRAAGNIAWCANLPLTDDGAVWREAVHRGRAVQGNPDALRVCSGRASDALVVAQDLDATSYRVEPNGPAEIVITAPVRSGDPGQQAADALYAVARGSLAVEYGPPLTAGEKALDALAASIVTSRGANGAGVGWNPPEPLELRQAGRELRENPRALDVVVEHVARVEAVLYPAWPARDRVLAKARAKEPKRGPEGPDVFDRDRERFINEIDNWKERRRVPEPEVDRIRLPGGGYPPDKGPAPYREPPHPEPSPVREPPPRRDLPGGPSR